MSIMCHLAFPRIITTVLATTLAAGLSGCSSSGNGSSMASISGSVFAGPVDGASCEIQDINNDTIAGPFTTSAGIYSINVPKASLVDDLMLVCSGGSYTDEADGSSQTAGSMAAYVAGSTLSAGGSIHATPESTIIHKLVTEHSKTLADAKTAFTSAFGYTPDTTVAPTDATNPASGASDDELLSGLRAAAFSQLAADLSLTPGQQFVLLEALARDLSDGTLDGVDGSGVITISGTATDLPVDVQNQFNVSMLKFHSDTTKNKTALTSDKIGILPFAKSALTTNYIVEYVPGMMAAMEGKTQFNIRLTARIGSGASTTGQSVSLMPMMHMATMNHATAVDGNCSESATAGTYECSIYYLMASAMANGTSMGYWDLKVMANGEEAHFYPKVMMAMGDTARADLKGISDEIMGMMAMEKRRYHIFKSSLTGMTDNHDFQIFIAARESMMSFPALVDGITLNATTLYELIPSTIIVEMSTDLSTWVTATADGNGYWTAAGLSGLTDDVAGEIYVKLSVSGEQKTTNGTAADSSNDYATFTVTPGM